MKTLIAMLMAACLLSGCLPMAIFASAGGAYNAYRQNWGMYAASGTVDTLCLSPVLRLVIWDFEGYFGRKVVASSGYRDPVHNARTGGADNSYHMKCMAADFFIPGVPKEKLIAFAVRNGMVGGLGCYPNRPFIHVDVRERPRGYKRPVLFSGC